MNNVLLINRTNPNDQTASPHKISFIVGEMHLEIVQQKIYEIIQNANYLRIEELIIKYNGIVIPLDIEKIPNLIYEFCKAGIKLYGVYELYEE